MVVQVLTDSQVHNLEDIVFEKANLLLEAKYKEAKESELYKLTRQTVLDTDTEIKSKYEDFTKYRDEGLELVELFQKAKEIRSTIYLPQWPQSFEDVEEEYNECLRDLEQDIIVKVFNMLKLQHEGTSRILLRRDIRAKLSMLPYDNFDVTVDTVLKSLDINTYLHQN